MDEYIENDKNNAPFLLALSYSGLITFKGLFIKNRVIYWKFSPKLKAQTYITQFTTKTEPRIPAKDIFDAIETFWKQVAKARNGENWENGKKH